MEGAAGLVCRIGVNLNQAVARVNATGQRPGELLWFARESMRRVERLDEAAEQVRKASGTGRARGFGVLRGYGGRPRGKRLR